MRFRRYPGAIFIYFLILFSISFGLVQAINDPTAQANIHASDVTIKFASEINPSSNYINHNANRDFYSIGLSPNTPPPDNRKNETVQPTSIVNTYYNTYNTYNENNISQSKLNLSKQNNSSSTEPTKKHDSNSATPTEDIRKKLGITIRGESTTSTDAPSTTPDAPSTTPGQHNTQEEKIEELRQKATVG